MTSLPTLSAPRAAAIVGLCAVAALSLSYPVRAGEVLPCALSGSSTVMFGGKPALRLSDVANCPRSLIEVLDGITIDGQPMVYLKSGADARAACAATGEVSILVNGKPAQGVGHVACMKAAGISP